VTVILQKIEPETELVDQRIVQIARGYAGQHEKAHNAGFLDAKFEAAMKSVGFTAGDAWCALFCELVWTQAFQGDKKRLAAINTLFSASAVQTWLNFKKNQVWAPFRTSISPSLGAVVVWKEAGSWQGHAGIVIAIEDEKTFRSMEGNTTVDGGREGVIVASRLHTIGERTRRTGLVLQGFIHPM
jgi:surface antigen